MTFNEIVKNLIQISIFLISIEANWVFYLNQQGKLDRNEYHETISSHPKTVAVIFSMHLSNSFVFLFSCYLFYSRINAASSKCTFHVPLDILR